MSDGDIYHMEINHAPSRQQLITITAARETVIDVALRVLLDSAPVWSREFAGHWPTLEVTVWKVSK